MPVAKLVPGLELIAALDRNGAIGRGNQLPWKLPDDLTRFKALTLGRTVLMGRHTAQSLGRALPQRRNLVLTRTGKVPFDGMEPVGTLDDAIALAGDAGLLVIGGGQLYELALPFAQKLRLTHVETVVEDADVFFPAFDAQDWELQSAQEHPADTRHAFAFRFADYCRRSSSDSA